MPKRRIRSCESRWRATFAHGLVRGPRFVLAALLLITLILFVSPGPHALPRSETPMTIMVEPGEAIRPDQARAPAFLLDKDDLLLVVDQLRGFLIGRFQPPLGLAPESSSFPGGVGLELQSLEGPPLPPAPITPIALQPGYPFLGDGAFAASPCLYDLEGDGRTELIVATTEGAVYLLEHDGAVRDGWPVRVDDGFYAAPSAADINGDGRAEVVLPGVSGWVYAWRHNGRLAPGWPVRPVAPSRNVEEVSFYAAASLADVNRDGAADICVATSLGSVWLLRGDGRVFPGWPNQMVPSTQPQNPPGAFAPPALVDLDGDQIPEIIAASNASRLHVWRPDGTVKPGWPIIVPHQARIGYTGVSLGDIDGDDEIDIVVTSEHGLSGPAAVNVFNADGTLLPGWPYDLTEVCNAQAALGDLTGDGIPEIVVATIGGNARLIALDGRSASPLPGWPLRIKQETVNSSPIIADIDGDGWNDVVVAALSTGTESDAWIWALDGSGSQLNGFPIMLPQDEILRASPSSCDLDGDGDLELIVCTERLNSVYAWDLEAMCDPILCPWSSEAGGPSRTGQSQPLPSLVPRAGGFAEAGLFPDGGSDLSTTGRGQGTPGGDGAANDGAVGTGPGIGGEESPFGGSSIEPNRGGARTEDPAEPPGLAATVEFVLPGETSVGLVIFNIQHQPVRHLLQHILPAGRYAIHWDGKDDKRVPQSSGIYFYRLDLGGRQRSEQLLLLQ